MRTRCSSLLVQTSLVLCYPWQVILNVFSELNINVLQGFVVGATGCTSSERLASAFFWIWLNLLQFDLANQCLDPSEDAANKPWRPIPSGRITVSRARALRWAVVPPCIALSHYHGISRAGCIFLLVTFWANELKSGGNMFAKNLQIATLTTTYYYGATIIVLPGAQCLERFDVVLDMFCDRWP